MAVSCWYSIPSRVAAAIALSSQSPSASGSGSSLSRIMYVKGKPFEPIIEGSVVLSLISHRSHCPRDLSLTVKSADIQPSPIFLRSL